MIMVCDSRKNKFNNKGSLLMEALLSVVILSVSITFIIQSMVNSLRVMNYGADYTQALILAENKMFDYVSKEGLSSGFYEEDEIESFQKKFSYKIETKDLQDERDDNTNDLSMSILWSNRGKERSLVLQTYAFKLQEE